MMYLRLQKSKVMESVLEAGSKDLFTEYSTITEEELLKATGGTTLGLRTLHLLKT